MKAFVFTLMLVALSGAAFAQTAPAQPALITSDTVQKKIDGPNITFSVDANPVNNTLRVRTNAKGPMQLEVNDASGHPVLTKALAANGTAISVPLGNVPAGAYVVRCMVADKTFMRRINVGQ
jgi:uncharacterized protein YccT (UPF0319 family)